MIERCQLAASEISELNIINTTTVTTAVEQLGYHNATRLIVTDHNAQIIYDSTGRAVVGSYALLPEILQALESNNVFSWSFLDGSMVSKAATPIYSYGSLTGAVYMLENDEQQGALISSLQRNILSVTLVLEVAVIIFSIFFSSRFSQRLKRIRTSFDFINLCERLVSPFT